MHNVHVSAMFRLLLHGTRVSDLILLCRVTLLAVEHIANSKFLWIDVEFTSI